MKPRESKKGAVNPEGTIGASQREEKPMSNEFCQYCEYRDTCREQ